MTPQTLQRYLHERIPLARAMEVEVRALASDGVELGAPLAPNINHRDTVFGGSASDRLARSRRATYLSPKV